MAKLEKRLGARAALIVAAGMVAITPSALAQSSGPNNPGITPQADSDANFPSTDRSNGLLGEGGSPFDLIHRAVLMNGTSMSDFSRQHQNRMNSEATNFRLLQQQAILQQTALEAEPNQANQSDSPEAIQ